MRLSDKASYIRTEIIKRNLGFCKNVTPEQIETILSLVADYDSKKCNKQPLLIIELEDESSVPKVIYEGEEITGKRNVFFDWDTDTDTYGGLSYTLEHVDTKLVEPGITRIERRVKGHAM